MENNVFEIFSLKNDVFKAFAFYSALLCIKMYAVTFATIYYRVFKRVFANPEDALCKGDRVGLDSDIERVRRAHLNDLENIIPFWVIGLLYVTTDPCPTVAINCFRVFAVSRFFHTFVYLFAIRQPARGLSFLPGVAINVFMATIIVLGYC